MQKNTHYIQLFVIGFLVKPLVIFSLLFFSQLEVNADTVLLQTSQFRESFTEEVNISGSVRAGVMFNTPLKQASPDALYVDIRNKSDQFLCIKMISIDGRYEAKIEYPLTGNLDGLTQFQFPTKLQNIVTSYAPEHIAVLAEIKKTCSNKSKTIIPASWGRSNKQNISVFLNSGVSQTYLKIYPFNSNSKKLPCNVIKNTRGTAYDTKCVINDPHLYDLSKTKIIRKNFDNYFKPVKLKIFINDSTS